MKLEYNYWSFICKLKNYYYGTKNIDGVEKKELSNRLEWFNDYFSMFNNPTVFHKDDLPDFKRGNIVLVKLGFNIGKEFGGRHYCIVLRDSSVNNKRVLILPITSKKPSDYEAFKNSSYIEFDKIKGMNAEKDNQSPTGHKRWVNIYNIRSVSKSRIIYPIDRGIQNMTKGQMREISSRIISQIALRKDLIYLQQKYDKLNKKYHALQSDYNS